MLNKDGEWDERDVPEDTCPSGFDISLGELDEITVRMLEGSFTCHRVWDAWEFGTMTKEDFEESIEDESFVDSAKHLLKNFLLSQGLVIEEED